jgi:hypothetical protein
MALGALEPPWPQVMGVLRAVPMPSVDQLAREQEHEAEKVTKGPTTLEALLQAGDTWDVARDESDA